MGTANIKNPLDVKFLKDCEVLSELSEEILRVVYNRGQIIKIEQGGVIFTANQPSDRFYVVKTGIVEICREYEPGKARAVAYLGTSSSIGELTMLTGSRYSSQAQMPGGGELFSLTRSVFLSLLDMLPEFGRSLSTLFAHRMESMAKTSHIDRRQQFSGSLKFFELPTIIQTIVDSNLTGTLSILNEAEELIAEVNFEKGALRGAFLGNLVGEEAFYQIFQPPPNEGGFNFKSGPIPNTGDNRYDINKSPSALLIEAVRQQDELIEMKRKIGDDDIFTANKEQLLWLGDESSIEFAEEIFALLKTENCTANQLVVKTRRCSHAVYSILKIMLVTKQIDRVPQVTLPAEQPQPKGVNPEL
jgi:CRP-like cAMP-binding protein